MRDKSKPNRKATLNSVALLLILVFFAGLAFSTFLKIHNNDIFWHITVGRDILQQGKISFPNPYNFTSDGRVYENLEWLFEIVAYKLASLDPVDFTFLILFRVVVFLAIYAICLRTALRAGVHPVLAVFLLTVSFLVINCRFFVRTFIISYLMIALYTHLLYENSKNPAPNRRLIIILPALMIIWANCHPISVVGIAMIGLAGLAELPNVFVEKKLTKRFSVLFFAGIATLMAQFIHPHPGKNIARIWYALREYPNLLVVSEEIHPPLALHSEYYIVFAVGILLLPIAVKMRQWFPILMFLAFGIMAFRNVRFLGPFSIAALPYFYAFAQNRINEFAKRRIFAAGLFIFMLASFGWFLLNGPALGTGVDCRQQPCAQVNFLLKNAPKMKLYNNLAYGGYTIWKGYPTLKPFWDGRFEAQKHLFWGLPRTDFSKFLIDNNIFLAMIPRRTEQTAGKLLNTEKQIFEDTKNWVPIFAGTETVILAHPSEKTATLIDQFGFRLINPLKGNFGLPKKTDFHTLQAFYSEAMKVEKSNPNDPYLLWIQTLLLRKLGEMEKAEKIADKCLNVDPRSPGCLSLLGLIKLQTDRTDQAIGHLKKAIRYGLSDASTFINLSTAYLRLGKAHKAKKALLKALQIDPKNKLAHYNLFLCYQVLGDKEKSDHHKKLSQ